MYTRPNRDPIDQIQRDLDGIAIKAIEEYGS